MIRSATRSSAALCLLLVGACASAGPRPYSEGAPSRTTTPELGILVMAHGGTPEWNQAVSDAIAPIRRRVPTAVAFGMADPTTLQAGLDSLESAGVTTVAVVRMFMSGESFREQTEYLLGMRADPPASPMLHHGGASQETLLPLRRRARVLLSEEGFAESGMAARILVDRVRALRDQDGPGDVLLLAHGMGSERSNDRLRSHMARAAASLNAAGVDEVRLATLREDWPDARKRAEAEIRAWMAPRSEGGRHVVVVPFRLFGFGPYADVLEGLDYSATDGFLPHPLVTDWIAQSGSALFCGAGLESPLGSCDAVVQGP